MPKNPNISTLNEIKTSEGKVVDQTITTFFKGPKSFTGEDMVEISFHGGPAIIKKIINLLSKKNNQILFFVRNKGDLCFEELLYIFEFDTNR